MKDLIPQSIKNIYHIFQAILANVWYGAPSRKLKIIGVTGTNGKTTTVQMIAKVLEEAGHRIAVASTINFRIGEREWVNDTKFTTLSSFRLQKHLRQALRAGCDYAVVEVTSHALDQKRVWGINFSVAVITNITREHLDYHKTIKKYSLAKQKLFQKVSRRVHGVSVVNLNMDRAGDFMKYATSREYGYFLETQNPKCALDKKLQPIIARDIRSEANGSEFTINGRSFKLNVPGDFNIENSLAAACVGLSQNVALETISAALAKIKGIPGRMENIQNDRGLAIIVDYAVTPDSLRKLYEFIGRFKKEESRIIAVFGSCGERDRGKRPIMGKIVAKAANFVIVTNEDPYGEDPQEIIDEVFQGVSDYRKENMNAWRIMDRREAIKKALGLARPGDIVVVTGKGAEEIMAVGSRRIPWNDPRVIREVLQEEAT